MHGVWRNCKFSCVAAVAMVFGLLSIPAISYGQSLKEQIVGTWRLVSIYNEENGEKHFNFGEKPVGMLMFDGSGNVIQFLSKSGVPKFAVANRLKGTDAENRVAIRSIIAGFGTYTVNGDTVAISWIASSYPNRAGTQEKRTYKITGDNMVGTNPVASSGGTSYSNYTRAK